MLDYYDGVKILRDKETKEPIGVEWIWNDGTKERYYPRDVKEAWFVNYVNDVKRSENLDRKERYHIDIHLDALFYEGDFFTDGTNPSSDLNRLEEDKNINAFMATLTEVERRRLEVKLDNPKISFEKMGKTENVSRAAIFKTFTSIRSKYNAFFCWCFY